MCRKRKNKKLAGEIVLVWRFVFKERKETLDTREGCCIDGLCGTRERRGSCVEREGTVLNGCERIDTGKKEKLEERKNCGRKKKEKLENWKEKS